MVWTNRDVLRDQHIKKKSVLIMLPNLTTASEAQTRAGKVDIDNR